MNVPTPVVSKVDLQGLIDAIAQASADDSMTNPLTQAQWDILSSYLLPVVMPAGQVLFTQGATDRTLYLVESGSLSVHYQDEKERLRLAIVGAGSVVGEGAFFSHRARSATVQATTDIREALLHYTEDDGPWQNREWKSLTAAISDGRVSATVPENARAWYLAVKDARGITVSGEHREAGE